MFQDFVFPDGDRPSWNSVDLLQRHFMRWFNREREKALLTFPVVTYAMLTEEGRIKDRPSAKFAAQELAQGNSFFTYLSDSADSLASCCRLRNEIEDHTFSYSLGAGGVATGSINVITLNMNRLVQDGRNLKTEVEKIQKYQVAYRKLMEEFLAQGLLPVYNAGLISLNKQYLTIGINGMVEAAESQGIRVGNSEEYKNFVRAQLQIIFESNREARRQTGYMFNTEFVPAENLGVKNAAWDRADGYQVARDCYNSYFYVVEDEDISFVDKFHLHGRDMIEFLDGGSALHLNLEEYLSENQFLLLLDLAALSGCNYFCTNVKVTICNDCGHIDKRTRSECSRCQSESVDYATRVIGYLKRITSFGSGRRREHSRRHYHVNARNSASAEASRICWDKDQRQVSSL
jgi:ribonucleoside-triphosphate reductase